MYGLHCAFGLGAVVAAAMAGAPVSPRMAVAVTTGTASQASFLNMAPPFPVCSGPDLFPPPDDRLAVTVVFRAGVVLPLFATSRQRGTITPACGPCGTRPGEGGRRRRGPREPARSAAA